MHARLYEGGFWFAVPGSDLSDGINVYVLDGSGKARDGRQKRGADPLTKRPRFMTSDRLRDWTSWTRRVEGRTGTPPMPLDLCPSMPRVESGYANPPGLPGLTRRCQNLPPFPPSVGFRRGVGGEQEALSVNKRAVLSLDQESILMTIRLPGCRIRFRADSAREMMEVFGLAAEATA